jgi:hypothetical protein
VQAPSSNPGSVLLSHTASRAVPSAPRSLTSEFGMGSGVASSRSPPEIVGSLVQSRQRTHSDFISIRVGEGGGIRNPNPAREAQSLP